MSYVIKSIWKLLSAVQRRAALLLLSLMILGMLLETAGIALILPVFAAFNGDLGSFQFDIPGTTEFGAARPALSALLLLLAFYIAKAVYLGFLSWRQSRFVFHLQADLSDWILSRFMAQPIEFHFRNHSTELGRQALHNTAQFARGAVMSCLTIAAESFVFIGLCSLLLWIKPLPALGIVTLLAVTVGVFYRIWRNKLHRWGKQREASQSEVHQRLHESLTAIKEIKLSGNEKEFLRRYSVPSHTFATLSSHQAASEKLPRVALELLAVTGIILLAGILILTGSPLSSLLPTLAVFAAAASRLLPSLGRILNHLNYLRFSMPVVDSLSCQLDELRQLPAADPPAASPPADFSSWQCLELSDISYTYPGQTEPVLCGLHLRLQRGGTLGITGPTGTGKSTLIDLMLGLLRPTEGQVTVDGVPITENTRDWHAVVGYVPQAPCLLDDTLARNIAFGIPDAEIDEDALLLAIETAQLSDFVASSGLGLHMKIGERGNRLSGGERQRIAIARALYRKPGFLVLDEASSGLDDKTESAVLKAISELPYAPTLLMVAHRRSALSFCDQIYAIKDLQSQH